MDNDSFPYIPAPLMKYLEETYPERCPGVTQNERSIWMYAGARDLVRCLAERFKEQSNNVLGS